MTERKKNRYITKAIAEELNLEIQAILWGIMNSVESKRNAKMDYLQIFNIDVTDKEIQIINKQEQPYLEEKYLFNKDVIINKNTTVWIIDEQDKQVMLFPSDY